MVSFSGDCEVSLGPLNLINQWWGSSRAGCGMLFNCSLVQSFVLFNLRGIKLGYKGPCFCCRTTPAIQQQALCLIPDPPQGWSRENWRDITPCSPSPRCLDTLAFLWVPHHCQWVSQGVLMAKGGSLAVRITQEFSRYLPCFLSLSVKL